MALHALVRLADSTILYERSDIDPSAGTKPGLVWLPVEVSTVGSGPITSGVVTTVLADKVTRVTTFREKTAEEISADKDAQTTKLAEGVEFELIGKVLFQMVNEIRVLKGQATITPAQFKTYLRSLL